MSVFVFDGKNWTSQYDTMLTKLAPIIPSANNQIRTWIVITGQQCMRFIKADLTHPNISPNVLYSVNY